MKKLQLKEKTSLRKKQRFKYSLANANNLWMWEENPRSKDYEMLSPSNYQWFHPTIDHYHTKDKRLVQHFMKANLQPERKLKSRSRINRMIVERMAVARDE